MTSEARTKAFFLQQILVYRAMGSSMFDVRVPTKSHWGGFPTHQLLDLRNRAVQLCPEQLVPGYFGNPETWRLRRLVESNFSTIASNQGGRKPDAIFLFGRVHHRDSTSRLIGNMDAPCSIKTSKHKWRNDENYTGPTYNDGSNMPCDQDKHKGWFRMLLKRTRAASRNCATVRMHNRNAGGTS
jgi:hypothetical protein